MAREGLGRQVHGDRVALWTQAVPRGGSGCRLGRPSPRPLSVCVFQLQRQALAGLHGAPAGRRLPRDPGRQPAAGGGRQPGGPREVQPAEGGSRPSPGQRGGAAVPRLQQVRSRAVRCSGPGLCTWCTEQKPVWSELAALCSGLSRRRVCLTFRLASHSVPVLSATSQGGDCSPLSAEDT